MESKEYAIQPVYQKKKTVNVGRNERLVSMIGGGALVLYALTRASRFRFPMLLGSGYLLHRATTGKDYLYDAMGINRAGFDGKEGVVVDRTMTVYRPRKEVYTFWRDLEVLPRFMEHLKSIEEKGDGRSHWVARGPMDASIEWDAEIVEDQTDERIAWRSLPGSEVENQGVITFVDAPAGRGTEVHVHLVYRPPLGSASTAVAKIFGEEPSLQILNDLRRFKQILEAGETATVTGQASCRSEQTEEERIQIGRRRGKDAVQEASEESFPASDPPSWTTSEGI